MEHARAPTSPWRHSHRTLPWQTAVGFSMVSASSGAAGGSKCTVQRRHYVRVRRARGGAVTVVAPATFDSTCGRQLQCFDIDSETPQVAGAHSVSEQKHSSPRRLVRVHRRALGGVLTVGGEQALQCVDTNSGRSWQQKHVAS